MGQPCPSKNDNHDPRMKILPYLLIGVMLCVSTQPLQAAPKKPKPSPSLKQLESEKKKSIQALKAEARKIQKSMSKVTLIPAPRIEITEDVSELEKAAESGDVQALLKLGHYHMMHPLPELENEKKAGDYFRKAAESGDADAKAWLAIYNCATAPHNDLMSLCNKLYEDSIMAARSGSLLGAYLAGSALYTSASSTRNDEIQELFKSAAEKGFAPAMRAYANVLNHKRSQDPNSYRETNNVLYEDAKAWMELSAKAGDILAAHELACITNATSDADLPRGEKIARKVLARAKNLSWEWYDGLLNDVYIHERGHYGGFRMRFIMRIYGDLNRVYMSHKESPERLRSELVSYLKHQAAAGDVEAMAALVALDRRWLYIMRGAHLPAPVNDTDYLPQLEKKAETGDMRAFILLRACKQLSRVE